MALSIQGIGPGTCTFLLVFDNGYFSEFGTFSITDWLGHTPPEVLARNFGLPASTFANFPKKEVYIATGPVPPTLPQDPAPGSLNEPPLTHRYRLLAAKPETFVGGTLRRVSATEFPLSTTMTGALLIIEPGGLRELHWHPHAAEWQYYIRGTGRMTVFGSHGAARAPTSLLPATLATCRRATATISRTPAATSSRWSPCSTTVVTNRSPSRAGWPPTLISCSPPISVCRRASSPNSPKTR
jgi:oxalate decarboxylase family bicupin protein